MITLIYGLVASLTLLLVIIQEISKGRLATSYCWISMFTLAFVLPGFIMNHVSFGIPDYGGSELGLRVVSTGALSLCVGGALYTNSRRIDRGPDVSAVPGTRLLSWTSNGNLAIMAVVVLGLSWLYFALLGRVPLLEAFQGGAGSLQEARLARDPYVNSSQARVPMAGLLESFRNVGVPALFAATLLRWMVQRRPWQLLLLALCVFTVVAAGQRWPLQYLLMMAMIALSLVRVDHLKRTLTRFLALGLCAGALLTVAQGRTGAGEESSLGLQMLLGIKETLERMSFGYVAVPALSYEMPEKFSEPLLGASYLQTLAALRPGPGESYAVTFYNVVFNYSSGYTASPDLATEAYLNYRWLGVIILPLLLGLLCRVFDGQFQGRGLSPEAASLIAMCIICIAATTTEGLVGSIMRPLVVGAPIFAALLLYRNLGVRGSSQLGPSQVRV